MIALRSKSQIPRFNLIYDISKNSHDVLLKSANWTRICSSSNSLAGSFGRAMCITVSQITVSSSVPWIFSPWGSLKGVLRGMSTSKEHRLAINQLWSNLSSLDSSLGHHTLFKKKRRNNLHHACRCNLAHSKMSSSQSLIIEPVNINYDKVRHGVKHIT